MKELKIKIKFLLIPFLILFLISSCFFKSSENVKLKEVDVVLNENFNLFINKFNDDISFQKRRVKFPLGVEKYWSEDSLSLKEINEEEYLIQKIESNAETEVSKKENDNEVILFVTGLDTGIAVSYNFKSIKNKWFLVSILDEST